MGVGDMLGDVFGNGMLFLCYICLLVVFDYWYIFFDLLFDVVMSFVECECLFNLLCLSWVDYDWVLISFGGGIFLCMVKLILFMLEVCVMFDVMVIEMVLNDLLYVIFKVFVDLFYNGGIGIYIKVSIEMYV